ncbi:MAG: hypothetical protein N3B17_08845 [Chlorobi bacterium]|nr:hypothetical protein [Chlorobiota bacterium]
MTTSHDTSQPSSAVQLYLSAEERFEDFLDVGHIPSVRRGVPAGTVLPAEFVAEAPNPVTVMHHEETDGQPIAILLEKDAAGIVRTIRVYCSCGHSAVIALEYPDHQEQSSDPVGSDDLSH